MRYAVCFYGQARCLNENSDNIIKNLIKPNNADVFVHYWNREKVGRNTANRRFSLETDDSKIGSIFNAKTISSVNPFLINVPDVSFKKSLKSGFAGGLEDPEKASYHVEASLSMWKSILLSQNLRRSYEIKNNFTYDGVASIRFDCTPTNKINLSDFDLEYFWGQDCNHPDLMINWLNFSNSRNMSLYGKTLTDVPTMYQETGLWVNEFFVKKSIESYGVKTQVAELGLTLQ